MAYVTFRDVVTGKPHDVWLGDYGSPESKVRYSLAIAEWERRGRTAGSATPGSPRRRLLPATLTVEALIVAYWQSLPADDRDRTGIQSALRVLNQVAGQDAAADFGPTRLREVRAAMIAGNPARGRRPWTRTSINRHIHRVRAVFRWAAAHERLPVAIYESLRTVEPLRHGRCAAVESEPVRPVPEACIEPVRQRVGRQVRAIIDLQLLTGARPGELLRLRLCDLDRTGKVWTLEPERHKTAHHGRRRILFFGPKAQAIINDLMPGKSPASCLFSPADAEREHREARARSRTTPTGQGNRPGSCRRPDPRRRPGEAYTVSAYRNAIARACDAAWPPPGELARKLGPNRAEQSRTKPTRADRETIRQWRARLTAEQWAEVRDWRREHRWHPYRLRHNAATAIRRSYGLEAARIILGHSSAQITDAVYAERDARLALKVAMEVG